MNNKNKASKAQTSPLLVKSFNKKFGIRSLSHSKLKKSETNSMLPSLKTSSNQIINFENVQTKKPNKGKVYFLCLNSFTQ